MIGGKFSKLEDHFLTTGYKCDWGIASVIEKGTTRYTRAFIEARKMTFTCDSQCFILAAELYVIIGGDEGKLSPHHLIFNVSVECHIHL